MRYAREITLTSAVSSIFDLLGHTDPSTDGILLQLVSGTVKYGNRSGTPFALSTVMMLPSSNTRGVYLQGPGEVVIGLF